jgi:hypothetical protein
VGNPVAENTIFAAFLAAAPDFAGDPVQSWCQPKQDPPDVLCMTAAGRQAGLELTEWLDQGQITEAKGMETIRRLRKASDTAGAAQRYRAYSFCAAGDAAESAGEACGCRHVPHGIAATR